MLTQGEIGRLLRPFAIRSKTLWPPGRRPRTKSESGYSRQQFEPAWASHCELSATPPQASKIRYLSRPVNRHSPPHLPGVAAGDEDNRRRRDSSPRLIACHTDSNKTSLAQSDEVGRVGGFEVGVASLAEAWVLCRALDRAACRRSRTAFRQPAATPLPPLRFRVFVRSCGAASWSARCGLRIESGWRTGSRVRIHGGVEAGRTRRAVTVTAPRSTVARSGL